MKTINGNSKFAAVLLALFSLAFFYPTGISGQSIASYEINCDMEEIDKIIFMIKHNAPGKVILIYDKNDVYSIMNESELKVEFWMLDTKSWGAEADVELFDLLYTEDAESELQVEQWMLEPFHVSDPASHLSNVTDPEPPMIIEDWMLNLDYWQ